MRRCLARLAHNVLSKLDMKPPYNVHRNRTSVNYLTTRCHIPVTAVRISNPRSCCYMNTLRIIMSLSRIWLSHVCDYKELVLCVVTPYSLAIAGSFVGTYSCHLHGRRGSQVKTSVEKKAASWASLVYFFPEGGCDILLRNDGVSPNYMALQPRTYILCLLGVLLIVVGFIRFLNFV
jgi:hypothetical protein